jgi:hypothetical protein
VSVLQPGDEHLHYSDGSHRWIARTESGQLAWEGQVRAHLDQHRGALGGPARCPRQAARIPRQRTAVRVTTPILGYRVSG